jgi:hypothetical protein
MRLVAGSISIVTELAGITLAQMMMFNGRGSVRIYEKVIISERGESRVHRLEKPSYDVY